jgi:hypothetical protein
MRTAQPTPASQRNRLTPHEAAHIHMKMDAQYQRRRAASSTECCSLGSRSVAARIIRARSAKPEEMNSTNK